MFELTTTLVIIVSSVGLFIYCFGYACRLILAARTASNYALKIAAENALTFAAMQTELGNAGADFARIYKSLDRDYALLRRLLKRQRADELGAERLMLAVNYRSMRLWYFWGGSVSINAARQALQQMALIVEFFANSVGEASVTTQNPPYVVT